MDPQRNVSTQPSVLRPYTPEETNLAARLEVAELVIHFLLYAWVEMYHWADEGWSRARDMEGDRDFFRDFAVRNGWKEE